MAQRPQTGSIEQVLRALKLLALSPAFALEMETVISYMGSGAFIPQNLTDINGNRFALTGMADIEFGDPSGWVSTSFQEVTYSRALLPVPPYPRLQLFAMPGRFQAPGEFDQEQVAAQVYIVDAIVVTGSDQADPALREALALSDGFERLVRRNGPALGGLVQLIAPTGPAAPGGPVETEGSGNVAGVLQRFKVLTLRSII